eukprot:TRINITY_DN19792_c0_g1_i1.p1 TRINITY_DN19792_c0_g1~~TRINITY_DN19792_c0_g1_i1.p1  ORF type:complete len:483 (+),score=134.86 TRINITY_DN19792_c0_g1_i1:90-1451(+)
MGGARRAAVLGGHCPGSESPAPGAAAPPGADALIAAVRAAVDTRRVIDELNQLRQFGAAGVAKGVIRPALSEADVAARKWLSLRFEGAGLRAETDGMGTVLARSSGDATASGGVLLMGSHSDTQPTGGWLDGALGVAYALEAARALRAAGVPGAWEVVSWQDEEGRFSSLTGSTSFVRGLPESVTAEGGPLSEARVRRGLSAVPLARVSDPGRGPYLGYLEAHIEQGAQLERRGLTLGVVDSICGMRLRRLSFEGRQNHAGTTRMPDRRDAARAMMRIGTRIDDAFSRLSEGHPACVWTFGRAEVLPGADSIVPGRATLSLQFRDPTEAHLDAMDAALKAICTAADRSPELGGVRVTLAEVSRVAATQLHSGMVEAVAEAAERVAPGKWQRMPSAAIHDAAPLSTVMPAAMLFVPSVGGVSHAFDEDTADADIAAGAEAFAVAAACALLRRRR